MKKNFIYGFIILTMMSVLFGCRFIPINKFLTFTNGDYAARIVIIDENKKNNTKIEYNIEPKMGYGWSEDIIGDFDFIYIKTENNIEGIFIVKNQYKKKLIPYDIITIGKYSEKISSRIEDDQKILFYDINITIIEDKFEIEYDHEKYNIMHFSNYDENYLINKEEYMKEYNYQE
jgi:hypothetical protein